MKQKQAVRKAFRDICLQRDNFKCKVCNLVAEPDSRNQYLELDVHHITDRNLLPDELKYVEENGITLCKVCHKDAEKFHISDGKEWVHGLHPNDLYTLIESKWRLGVDNQVQTS
jgi:5-methylcytosine-specific restriction endonuclease McrA